MADSDHKVNNGWGPRLKALDKDGMTIRGNKSAYFLMVASGGHKGYKLLRGFGQRNIGGFDKLMVKK